MFGSSPKTGRFLIGSPLASSSVIEDDAIEFEEDEDECNCDSTVTLVMLTSESPFDSMPPVFEFATTTALGAGGGGLRFNILLPFLPEGGAGGGFATAAAAILMLEVLDRLRS